MKYTLKDKTITQVISDQLSVYDVDSKGSVDMPETKSTLFETESSSSSSNTAASAKPKE